MFQTVTALNFIIPEEGAGPIDAITLRGYKKDTYIPGQFAGAIRSKEIKPLSVSDISDILCPKGRDLYYKKGKNKPRGVRRKGT